MKRGQKTKVLQTSTEDDNVERSGNSVYCWLVRKTLKAQSSIIFGNL